MSGPEQHAPSQEQPAEPYLRAVRFSTEPPSQRAYERVQDAIFRAAWDLSVYRFRLDQPWYVVVMGSPPPEPVDRRLRRLLAAGEPSELPEGILGFLRQRRDQMRRLGPWVERHYRGH
jgi:hypothetical protein